MVLVSWSELPSLAGVARLAGEPLAGVAAEAGSFPPGVRGVAVLRDGEVVGSGVLVDREVDGVRYASIVRVRAREEEAAGLLMDALARQARAKRATRVRVSVVDAPGLAARLSREGYTVVDAFLEQRRAGPPAPAPLPAGLTDVPVTEVAEGAFLAVRNAAFAGTAGAFPFTAEDWRVVRSGPGFDGSLVRVLLRGGVPVGFLHGALRGERGEVEAIGLVPGQRRKGLGRALLRRCEGMLADRGATEFGLMVAASNAPAVRLYAEEGYRTVGRRETWAR